MPNRIVLAILAAAVSVAFGFPPATAQQPQPPQSGRGSSLKPSAFSRA